MAIPRRLGDEERPTKRGSHGALAQIPGTACGNLGIDRHEPFVLSGRNDPYEALLCVKIADAQAAEFFAA